MQWKDVVNRKTNEAIKKSARKNRKRWRELEKAVEELLTMTGHSFIHIQHYCPKCGMILNAATKGFPDFHVISPINFYVECKTGSGSLSKPQREVKRKIVEAGGDYIELHDTVDELENYLKLKKCKALL